MKLKFIAFIVLAITMLFYFFWFNGSQSETGNQHKKEFWITHLGENESIGAYDTEKARSLVINDGEVTKAIKDQLQKSGEVNASEITTLEIRKMAESLLTKLRIDYSGRECEIKIVDTNAICKFLPPENTRGGDFIVIVDLRNRKIVAVKIYR